MKTLYRLQGEISTCILLQWSWKFSRELIAGTLTEVLLKRSWTFSFCLSVALCFSFFLFWIKKKSVMCISCKLGKTEAQQQEQLSVSCSAQNPDFLACSLEFTRQFFSLLFSPSFRFSHPLSHSSWPCSELTYVSCADIWTGSEQLIES